MFAVRRGRLEREPQSVSLYPMLHQCANFQLCFFASSHHLPSLHIIHICILRCGSYNQRDRDRQREKEDGGGVRGEGRERERERERKRERERVFQSNRSLRFSRADRRNHSQI